VDVEEWTHKPTIAVGIAAWHEDVLLGNLVSGVRPTIKHAAFGIKESDTLKRPASFFATFATAGEREYPAVPPPRVTRINAGKLGNAGRRILYGGCAVGLQDDVSIGGIH
jgi:hypothetical protein